QGIFIRRGQRLFAEDVFARCDRLDGEIRVRVVGRDDADGVDRVVVEDVLEVRESPWDVVAQGKLLDAFGDHVACRDEAGPAVTRVCFAMHSRHAPGANDPDPDCTDPDCLAHYLNPSSPGRWSVMPSIVTGSGA